MFTAYIMCISIIPSFTYFLIGKSNGTTSIDSHDFYTRSPSVEFNVKFSAVIPITFIEA